MSSTSRATVSFVSTQILSSSDGIKHDEIKRIQPNAGGLEVRVQRNRDEEKLKARQGTNLTLYEQLQQNKEDKEEDHEAQIRESRLPKSLDEEEVAFLEEQNAKAFQVRRQQIAQEDRDILEFHAARLAFDSSKSFLVTSGGISGSNNSTSLPSNAKQADNSATSMPAASVSKSRVVFRRKRKQTDATEASPSVEEKSKRPKMVSKQNINPSLALISNYASSSDDEV